MKCSGCGEMNRTGASYCSTCGRPLATEHVVQTTGRERRPTNGPRRWFLVIVAVLVVVVVVAAFALRGDESDLRGDESELTTIDTKSTAGPSSGTLPPVEPPPMIALSDFQSIQLALARASALLDSTDLIADLVDRYPSWNQVDQHRFVPVCGTVQNMTAYYALGDPPSPAINTPYPYWVSFRDGMAMLDQAMPLLIEASTSRDVSAWTEGVRLLHDGRALLAEVVTVTQMLYDYGSQGNVDHSATSGSSLNATAADTMPRKDTSPQDAAVTGGRPVLRVSPSGKVLAIGDSVPVTAEVKSAYGTYDPVDLRLESDDASVVEVRGETITAVGTGNARVHVHAGGLSEYVSIVVFADEQTRDAEAGLAYMVEDPIYSDGRVTIGVWPTPEPGDGRLVLAGFLENKSDAAIRLSLSQFALSVSQGDRRAPMPGSSFSEDMWEGEDLGDTCTVEPGGEVGLYLVFPLANNDHRSGLWLLWDDGLSLVPVEFMTTPATVH